MTQGHFLLIRSCWMWEPGKNNPDVLEVFYYKGRMKFYEIAICVTWDKFENHVLGKAEFNLRWYKDRMGKIYKMAKQELASFD